LRLTEDVLDRSTFCFPDSVFEPADMATADRFNLFPLTRAFDARELTDEVEATEGGLLDDYIEAHVHGTVNLASHVEALVLDPCFHGTPVADQAHELGIPVEWHEGRRLSVADLERHPTFRGPETVDVGRRIAEDGYVDARVIGRAAAAGAQDPQDLKKVWHCIARFGSPID
jgi:hypothetical protein